MHKPTEKLGSNLNISHFLKPFFDTLDSTIDIENANLIDETYPYTILSLCKTFFLLNKEDFRKVYIIESIIL